MARRMVLMLLVVAAFLGVIGFVKYRQIQAGIAAGSAYHPPPEAVTTVVANSDQWEESLGAIGTVSAVNGVVISADLEGVVETINFESGARVEAGAILVQQDTRQERAQLAASEARRELTRLNLDRAKGLRDQGVISQADLDAANAAAAEAEGDLGEIRATIGRKTIRAPFAGVLGIRQVNLGQYLTGGTPIVPLQSLDPVHVDFSVPQQALSQVPPGAEVRIMTEDISGEPLSGKVSAVDSLVDASTRNVMVRATLANPGHRLRPGMFVRAQVILPGKTEVIAVPASSIRFAPYGDSVFIVEDVKGPDGASYQGVRQQVVKIGAARGDLVAILSGIKSGEEVVTSGVFKLRNGAAVQVNNAVKPGESLTPKPEDS